MAKKQKADPIYRKLEELHKDVKELREKDIPNLKIDVAVMKEKTSIQAKIISTVGGLIAVAVSTAIAWLR